MNNIYLPHLLSINVKDFSLFPNGLDFKYNFVKGVNLIIGGNGIGKTTFISLIKYGLIGLYKKDLGFVRTYRERSIETRRKLPYDYFSNRMDPTYTKNEKAEITITFLINKTFFIVTRNIYNIELKSVFIKEKDNRFELKGIIAPQSKYDKLEDNAKEKYLQFKYEQYVKDKAHLFSFDDFIFFINEILIFDENHKTILWDDNNEGIQERLSSKYFNDPNLDNAREEASRKAKYFDSLARHKSEDIRAIRKVLDQLQKSSNVDDDFKDLINKQIKLKSNIEKINNKIDLIYQERENLITKSKINSSNKNKISKQIEDNNNKLKDFEYKYIKNYWEKLNPKYQIYFANIQTNSLCPMCNQNLNEQRQKVLENKSNECFLCNQKLFTEKVNLSYDNNILLIKSNIEKLLKEKKSLDFDSVNIQENIESLDKQYKETETNLFNSKNELRTLEHSINKDTKGDKVVEFKAMLREIENLEKIKYQNQEKSKNENEIVDKITQQIETENTKITNTLSNIFSDFAQNFYQ